MHWIVYSKLYVIIGDKSKFQNLFIFLVLIYAFNVLRCTKWSINCANFLLKLVKANVTYKDAFRELGLLEMTVSCLYKFANLLKEKHVDSKGKKLN